MARARTSPAPKASVRKTTTKPAAAKPVATTPAAKRGLVKPSKTKRAAAKPAAQQPAAKQALTKRATTKRAAAAPAAKPTRRSLAAQTAPHKTAARSAKLAKPAPNKAPAKLSGGIAVVKVIDSKQPIEALRKFLARITGSATMEEGQIALGSAQLMLLPIAHGQRGGSEVKQLLDLVLARWDAFPDRTGFHAQEFLRNAFAAVGNDRERIARLAQLVPDDATSELRFNMAGAYAVANDRAAMLHALEAALTAGATAAQVRRDPDFASFVDDPAVTALLARAAVPAIPVDVAPHVAPVRAALDSLIETLRELGEPSKLNPPATLDAVLATERASKIQLPNDYRALLTITNGMAMCDHEFFGTPDYADDTTLGRRARAFLHMSASYGGIGMDECVPLANWGQPNQWLLYDPRGTVREGAPGYVVMMTADPWPMHDLADALRKIEHAVRDIRGTN